MVDKDLHMIAYSSWLAVVSSQCVCVCAYSVLGETSRGTL